MALKAKDRGVEVNLVSIEGEQCKLEMMLPLVDQTNGEITKVNPRKLTQNFSNILETPVIATHVKVSLTLHRLLKFRNAEGEQLQNRGSKVTKEVGNATEDSQITFEYT